MSDFSCGKGTLQGRKKNVYFKRENFTFWPNWLCIEDSSAGHVNIGGLMKPWRMTVSKVHIIYGEVTVGKQSAVHLRCCWWPESHEWSLEFLGQNLVVEPKLSWQPLPKCATPPCTHWHWPMPAHAHSQKQIHTHACAAIQLRGLGVLAKFLNLSLACWVGGSRLPENSGMG